ncbi:sigma-70 family RNA polymerase sigma factor [Metasolibacillus meyeri]|uniref:Sigma-70 family RNA polymerase sigma factor n=1 Tax=Metasolibacillus meyeri TaxID=1071052 RepID=A0AAW9NMF6_9BACL|nr:sigma-70 family RNA polymerase sigma factor [Metasolibacillus meyeri]MEC1177651.1 sigma-70 family RNA polymerase sigma factor [Metasolibacillus meyeri]
METLTPEQDMLIRENTGLVHYYSKKYFAPGMDRSDFVQAGTVGLIQAAKIFDGSLGYKFSTIASRYIMSEMVKLFSKKRVETLSLNEVINGIEPIDFVVDRSVNMNEVLLKIDLPKALSILTETERFVINHSFGLENGTPISQYEIGQMCGFSQSHIGRIRGKALRKLKAFLKDYEGVTQ